MKYKIGDKVKILESAKDDYHTSHFVGAIGKITDITGEERFEVTFEKNWELFWKDDIELLSPKGEEKYEM